MSKITWPGYMPGSVTSAPFTLPRLLNTSTTSPWKSPFAAASSGFMNTFGVPFCSSSMKGLFE